MSCGFPCARGGDVSGGPSQLRLSTRPLNSESFSFPALTPSGSKNKRATALLRLRALRSVVQASMNALHRLCRTDPANQTTTSCSSSRIACARLTKRPYARSKLQSHDASPGHICCDPRCGQPGGVGVEGLRRDNKSLAQGLITGPGCWCLREAADSR